MKGWCNSTSAVIFGQLVSGMVRLGRATRDGALIDKANALFEGWRETLPPDGNARMRAYDWDKLVCGLVDLGRYGGATRAVLTLRQTVEWASRTFDRTRQPADGHDFWGAGPGDTSEWYTLSENLYRAYLVSGDPLVQDFADTLALRGLLAAVRRRPSRHPEVLPVHAYSHVNSFSSAAAGLPRHRRRPLPAICLNAYDFLQRTQCYATGGYGPDERLMPPDGSLGRSLDVSATTPRSRAVRGPPSSCRAYLIGFTGEARFGDWIETIATTGWARPCRPEPDGKCFYYGDYRPSAGTKQHYWHEWPCCSGTYIQNMAEYHNMIYLQDDERSTSTCTSPRRLTLGARRAERHGPTGDRYPEAGTEHGHADAQEAGALRAALPCSRLGRRADLAVNGRRSTSRRSRAAGRSIEREWNSGDTVLMTSRWR